MIVGNYFSFLNNYLIKWDTLVLWRPHIHRPPSSNEEGRPVYHSFWRCCVQGLFIKFWYFEWLSFLNDYIFLKNSPEMYLSSVRNWINIRFGFDDSFLLFVIPEMGKWQRDWCCDHQRSRWQSFLCRWRHQRWAAACRFNHWSLCSFSLCLSCRGLLVTEVTNSFSKG